MKYKIGFAFVVIALLVIVSIPVTPSGAATPTPIKVSELTPQATITPSDYLYVVSGATPVSRKAEIEAVVRGGLYGQLNVTNSEIQANVPITVSGNITTAGAFVGNLPNHDHSGDTGDGGVLESDEALAASGITDGYVFMADGANATGWEDAGDSYYTWFDITYSAEGVITTTTGTLRYYAPIALTIDKVYIAASTAPTSTALIVDVNKNGTTIFTTQGGRPSIAAGANTDESDTPDVTDLAKNDYVTVDIDQIGDVTPGSNLTIHVRCKQYLQLD